MVEGGINIKVREGHLFICHAATHAGKLLRGAYDDAAFAAVDETDMGTQLVELFLCSSLNYHHGRSLRSAYEPVDAGSRRQRSTNEPGYGECLAWSRATRRHGGGEHALGMTKAEHRIRWIQALRTHRLQDCELSAQDTRSGHSGGG